MDALNSAYQQARAAIAHYQLQDARQFLNTAKHLLETLGRENHVEMDLRIRLTESWLTCDDHGLQAALEQVSAARRDAEEAGRDDLRGLAHIQAGVLNARAGHVEEGLAQLRIAVGLSAVLPAEDRVRLLINKGAICSQAGELDEAARDLHAAKSMTQIAPQYAFMATHNLGFVEYLRGDLPSALRWMAAADELPADVDRSVSRLDRARVLMEVGMVGDAEMLLQEATTEMRELHLFQELLDAQLELAKCAFLRWDSAAAAAHVDRMLATAEGHEDRRHLEARLLRVESSASLADIPESEIMNEVLALVASAREAGWTSLADRGVARWVILVGGQGAEDPQLGVRSAVRRMRASPYLATRALAIRAQLEMADSERQRARLLRAAALDIATARAGMSNLDLRSAMAIHMSPVIKSDVSRAVARGDPWAALSSTERWRTALDSVPTVLPPADPVVATLWSRLRQCHEHLRDAHHGGSENLRREVTRIERQLRERSWTSSSVSSLHNRRPPRRAELGCATVLSYAWTTDGLSVVSISPGHKAELVELGPAPAITQFVVRATADASAAARVGHGLLTAGVMGSLSASLERLDEMLLPPDIRDGSVIIVPGGSLVHLPWGMLPRLRDRPVTVSRSLTAWNAGRTHVHGVPRVAAATGPGLELADQEAQAVCGQWGRAVRMRGTANSVTGALSRHDVVHIAAHGSHRADNPLFSSLRLHGGALFAHELERVSLASSLVVLSACSAGRAHLRPGDEALGLTSSLLAMGVRAVVAPLTDVPDEVACETMAALHSGLASGLDGPSALAAASSHLLARSFTWFGSDWQADTQM